mmetsp:Transcript_132380/g.243428  ORF Transcript_132380/g.243428 Transcript_132380/m.243428 type:complete len:89 (+) Transcript_132380:442-708(+)
MRRRDGRRSMRRSVWGTAISGFSGPRVHGWAPRAYCCKRREQASDQRVHQVAESSLSNSAEELPAETARHGVFVEAESLKTLGQISTL